MAFQNTGFQNTAFQIGNIAAAAVFAVAVTISSQVSGKTLYYQSIAEPPPRPPDVASNLTTTMEWLPAWQAAVSQRPLYYQASATVTTVEIAAEDTTARSVSIGGPTVQFARTLQYKSLTWVPPAPEADNNVTGTGYIARWALPAKKTWPPLSAADLRQFAVPTVRDGVEWMQAWQGPPRYQPPKIAASPFVPNAATLENTITGVAWLRPWLPPVPTPKPRPTQPVFGAPYEAAANLTTTLEWMPAWRGPPNYNPPWIASEPFVPKAATLENTITGIAWMRPLNVAAKTPKPVRTELAFGYPFESQAIVVPYEQWWHQPLSRAVARPAVHAKPYQPFVPRAATLENTITGIPWLIRFQKAAPHGWPRYAAVTVPVYPYEAVTPVTPDKWLQRWQGPPRYRPPKIAASPFVPRAATLENTITGIAWHRPFYPPVEHGWPTHTQPFFGYPYAGVFSDLGPADEHERVACVPLASRVAIVPELSRVTDVPFSDRDQDSNEYRDRTCGTPAAPVATEPEVPSTDSAFQEDTFDADDFQ